MAGQIVSQQPDPDAVTEVRFYNSGNLEYVGFARSKQPPTEWRRDGADDLGFTSIVVASNVATLNKTAHGLLVANRLRVEGATVDTDLNGSYAVATVPGANSLTFATTGVADGTYTEATLKVTTAAPRTSKPVWAIKRIFDPAAPSRIAWAGGTGSQNQILDNRATLAYD